jgi:hypothetical protein
LRNARDNDTYIMTTRLSRSPGRPDRSFHVLVNSEGDQGRARAWSLPYDGFERAVLSKLREIDARDILNGDTPPDETAALAAELVGVEAELADAVAFMEANGFSPTIGKRITDLESKKSDLAIRLADARQKAAHPLSESWGEAKSLIDILDASPDPRGTRLRLRSALRRVVESMHLLVVGRGLDRLCALQVWFAGGKRCRDYVVVYKPGSGRRRAKWLCGSFAGAALPDKLDLRRQEHVDELARDLEALDLEALQQALSV